MSEKMTFYEMRTKTTVYPPQIPTDLQATINSYFDLRRVCDNDNFTTFFSRTLTRDYQRYYQLLRIEPGIAQYDWLVENYSERQRILTAAGTASKTGSTSGSVITTGTSGNMRTFDTTDTENATNTTTGTVTRDITIDEDGSNSGTNSTENSATADSAVLTKNAPMSIENTVTTGGVTEKIPPLSWGTATTQEQDGTSSTENSSATNSGSYQTDRKTDDDTESTKTETKGGTYKKTGTVADSGTNSKSTENSGTATETADNSRDETTQEIYTGRTENVAELLERASAFIKASSAWEWLRKQLEPCFSLAYDI